jgi:exodeoxyribonuclease VII small subunit
MARKKENIGFEEALEKLEDLVSKLEDTEIPLDESIAYFEEAMNLSKVCSNKLNEAERKISMLIVGKDGENSEVNFEMEGMNTLEK